MTLKSQAQSSPIRLTFQPLGLQFILSGLKITISGLKFTGLSLNLILKCDLSELKSHMNPSRKKSGKLPLLISIQSPISALLYLKSALKAPWGSGFIQAGQRVLMTICDPWMTGFYFPFFLFQFLVVNVTRNWNVASSSSSLLRETTLRSWDHKTPRLRETERPWECETVRLRDREIARPWDCETVRLRDRESARPWDCETVRS